MPKKFQRYSQSLIFRTTLLLGLFVCSSVCNGQGGEKLTSVTSTESSESVSTDFLYDGTEPTSIEQLRYMEQHVEDLAAKVKRATVNIRLGAAQGTGVVVSEDGYVLTAAHVIAGPVNIAKITFTNEDDSVYEVDAERLGIDRGKDSGMLKILNPEGKTFPYLDVGLSSELNLGQWVMAVGHPGGLDKDRGMVVRIGRIVYQSSRNIKTDCTLVGGDSGGPLVDMNGEVIGIHSRIGQRLLDNLHVPIDIYSEDWDDMAEGIILDGQASLGFSVDEDSNLIDDVHAKGPAEKAGLEIGDKIIDIGGEVVINKATIGKAIRALDLRPNKKVDIIVLRNGEKVTLNFKVGEKRRR